MKHTIKLFRNRFGMKALIALVAVCALLLGAWRFSRDQGPAYLYTGWLFEGDESRRAQAALELGAVNEETSLVVNSLARALVSDRAVAIRTQSARSLARIVSKRQDEWTTATATNALVQALSDNDSTVRAAAADALGQIAPEPELVIPALLRATNDGDEWVRGAAIAALGLIQRKAWIDQADVRLAIAAAMVDPSLHVRELGIYAFWATAEVSPGFSRALLRDNDVRVRRAAVHALARSEPLATRNLRDLTVCLNDADESVRSGAAHALENTGGPVKTESDTTDAP